MSVAFTFPQAQPTPLLGRAVELDTIERWLVHERGSLLSLVGPGGVGKTRLAVEAGNRLRAQFADGIVLVYLASIREPEGVPPAIAQALGLVDIGPRPALDRLREHLRDRSTLLILDNFEQVLPAGAVLAELLAAAPGLKILVTSRSALRLRRERVLRINPLAVPDPDAGLSLDALLQFPSVALFTERVRAQRTSFVPSEQQTHLLVRLTQQLDGLPLAIELAAANMQVLSLGMIVDRLSRRLHSLEWDAEDLPGRQRSLHAAIGWSYDLLSDDEQRLFRHLGVFVGRVSLDGIAAVMDEEDGDQLLEDLLGLADKSLVLPARFDDEEPEPAFGMLETVRQYAYEQLEAAGELSAAHRAHALYFLALAEQGETGLHRAGQLAWLRRLEVEHDNLRVALRWLLDHDKHEQALQVVGALGSFWFLRGHVTEGVRWLEEALDKALNADPIIRARALTWTAQLLALHGDSGRCVALLRQALDLAIESGDRASIAHTLVYLGASLTVTGSVAEGKRLLQEALTLCEEMGDDYYVAAALSYLAVPPFQLGQYREAAELYSAALSLLQRIGELTEAPGLHYPLAVALAQMGDRAGAVRLIHRGLRMALSLLDRAGLSVGIEYTLLLLGESADSPRRARLLGAEDALAQAGGFTTGLAEQASGLSLQGLRITIEREELQQAYQEGRALALPQAAALALSLLEELSRTRDGERATPEESVPAIPLTAREHEILGLASEGLTNKEIARRLFLSHRTVEHHLSSVFDKLGVDNRSQAVAVATRAGLV